MASLLSTSKALREVVRLQPHDTTTAEGRARERHRRIVLSAIASTLAKFISAGTALISVPLTLHYLGAERYGMWMTTSSLVAILSFADLGIGNGMLSTIAAAHGRDDHAAIRSYVSSGFLALTLVAGGLLLAFAALYSHIPWPRVFNVHSALAQREAGRAVGVFVVCFAAAIPISIVQRVQMALQRGFLASLWQCVSSALGLIGVVVAIQLEAGLPWLVLAYMGAPLVASIFNGLLFFCYLQPDIAPARRYFSLGAARLLLRTGGLFIVLQVVAAAPYATDNLIIAQLRGAPAVAEFAVPERMFSLITVVLALVLAPLWPAYGEAIARGDLAWVRYTLRRSLLMAVALAGSCSFMLVVLGPWLIHALVGQAVVPTFALLLGLAVWKTAEAGGNALGAFLNGAHVVRAQVVMAIVTAVSALALKIGLISEYGIAVTPWATALSYLLLTAVPTFILLPRILKSRRLTGASPT